MKVLQIRGCWAANIGNAFLDVGCAYQIEQVVEKLDMTTWSGHNKWAFDYFSKKPFGKKEKTNEFPLENLIYSKFDILVFTGMVLTEGFFARYRSFLNTMKKRPALILFNGAGLRN